jgi:hypothetical protein
MKHASVIVTSVVFALLQVGCGGNGGGAAGSGGSSTAGSGAASAACDKVNACGGDMVGEWKMTAACADPPKATTLCDAATAVVGAATVTGTASYKGDMTFTLMGMVDATATLTLPASCLMQGGKTLTCSQIQTILATDPTAKLISCTASGTGCKCLNPYHSVLNNTGTYSVSGSMVTLTIGKDKATADFCAKDNKLHLAITSSSGELPTGQISLTK